MGNCCENALGAVRIEKKILLKIFSLERCCHRMKQIFLTVVICMFSLSSFIHASQCEIIDSGTIVYSEMSRIKIECVTSANADLIIETGEERGRGSFGTVFDAHAYNAREHAATRERVVIKRITLEKKFPEGYEEIEGVFRTSKRNALKEFQRMQELIVFPQLKPFLVKPIAFFVINHNAFIVMEDAGEPLREFFGDLHIDHARFLLLAQKIIDAVNVLHQSDIVHLDLHPGNILLGKNDSIKIIDFGFAKRSGKSVNVVGNRQFRDPHIYKTRTANFTHDHFSVAAIFFEIAFERNLYSLVERQPGEKIKFVPGTKPFKKLVKAYKKFCGERIREADAWQIKILSAVHPQSEDRISL